MPQKSGYIHPITYKRLCGKCFAWTSDKTMALAAISALALSFGCSLQAMANDEADQRKMVAWVTELRAKLPGNPPHKPDLAGVKENDLIKKARSMEKPDGIEATAHFLEAANRSLKSPLLSIYIAQYLERLERDDKEVIAAYSTAVDQAGVKPVDEGVPAVARNLRATKFAELSNNKSALADCTWVIDHCRANAAKYAPVDSNRSQFYSILMMHTMHFRGELYYLDKKYSLAMADAEDLIREFGFMSEGFVLKSRIFEAEGNKAEALKWMKEGTAHGAKKIYLANLEMHTSGSYEESYAALSKAIGDRQNGIKARQRRADFACQHNHPTEALADYQVLLKVAPNDETLLLGRAKAYLALKRPQEAIQDFTRIIESDRQLAPSGYRGRAEAYRQLHNEAQAKKDMASALK